MSSGVPPDKSEDEDATSVDAFEHIYVFERFNIIDT